MGIRVGLIKFGETDAKNEVFQQGRYGSTVFRNAFQIPPTIDLDELLQGARFFITGQKGCGKTALLHYLRDRLSEQGANTHIIFFKSGLLEQERQQLATGLNYQIIDTTDTISVQYEYTVSWLWLIMRNLMRLIKDSDIESGHDIAHDLKKLVGVDNEIASSAFSDLSIKKVKAQAKAGLSAGPFRTEISGEVEAVKEETPERTAMEIIQLCERYLPKIRMKIKSRCLLFFDELELFWNRPDQRERDLFLIRDLLQSVARVNRALGASSASFVVYASVRSEVLEEVNRVGPEIARDVADFGARINWNVRKAALHQPILTIVEAKIQASEIENDELPTGNVWKQYFPEPIFGRDATSHLLDISMFKP